MNSIKLVTCIALVISTSGCKTTSNQNNSSINYVAEGDLAITNEIGCVPSSELNNKLTPPDLYEGMVQCIKDKQYDKGVYLFALAGTYSRYDTYRVADRSSHQAHSVLAMNARNKVDESLYNEFFETVKVTLTKPEGLKGACDQIKNIGLPDYYPTYMIQHGMGAFSADNSGDGLVSEFDSEAAWQSSLNGYLHCDG